MGKPIIPAKALQVALPALAAGIHKVRLVLALNADITLKRVTVEGAPVTKWTMVDGFYYWENPKQVVNGTLDVTLEAQGGKKGSISLVTLCDDNACGTINLVTASGPASQEEHYEV